MNDLYVQPNFRRLGIAVGLISEILKNLFNNRYQGSSFKRRLIISLDIILKFLLAKKEVAKILHWLCLKTNEKSQKFYERIGAKKLVTNLYEIYLWSINLYKNK